MAVGDVNKDRHPDLVVTSPRSLPVTILLGQGDGRLAQMPAGAFAVPESPDEMALGDVNSDGNVDLALASHDSYRVVLLFGDGRGGFRLAPNSPIVMKDGRQPHTHGLGIADFNGDGKADLVSVNSNDDNDVAVVLGDGQGRFIRAVGSPFAVGPVLVRSPSATSTPTARWTWWSRATGFSNGSRPVEASGLTALFGDGRGGFRRAAVPLRTGHTWFVAIGDVNGDRNPDLVATHGDAPLLSVLLGDGRGSLHPRRSGSPFDLGHKAWYAGLVDLNRDGNSDIVAAADSGVRALLGDGRGAFAQAPGSPFATGKGTWRLAVADVNADGHSDVATSNLESDSVTVLVGQ